jgi:hypothetical protein
MAMTRSRLLEIFAAIALTVGAAGLALAQGKKDEVFGTGVSSQCADVSPRLKDECVRRLRSQAEIGSERSWQGGASSNNPNPGIGHGASGGHGKGRR